MPGSGRLIDLPKSHDWSVVELDLHPAPAGFKAPCLSGSHCRSEPMVGREKPFKSSENIN